MGVLELRGVGCWSWSAGVGTSNGTVEKLLKFRIFVTKFLKKKGLRKGGMAAASPVGLA